MIVRIEFIGIVKDGKGKKYKMSDHVDIHTSSVAMARGIMNTWLRTGAGIRGDSGVFHPLRGYGSIVVKDVVKV